MGTRELAGCSIPLLTKLEQQPQAQLRLAWIADTLHTEVLGVSPALLDEARGRAGLEVVREPAPMPFDAEGRLRPLSLP